MTEFPIFAFPTDGVVAASQADGVGRARPPSVGRASLLDPAGAGEAEMIDRAQRDPRAFAMIYRGHYDAMAGYVFRRLGDVHGTEDVVADLFMTAMRSLPRYRYRGVPLRAWLYAIATRACNQWVRRRRRHRLVALSDDVAERGVTDAASSEAAPDSEFLRRALLGLSVKNQTVLALYYLEGLSVEEVGTVTGWRIGTVKSRLSRAREALREKLSRGRTRP